MRTAAPALRLAGARRGVARAGARQRRRRPPRRSAARARRAAARRLPRPVRGQSIAARRALPELYANRDFTPRVDLPRGGRRAPARDPRQRGRRTRSRGLPARPARERPQRRRSATVLRSTRRSTTTCCRPTRSTRLLYHLIFGKVDPKSFDPQLELRRARFTAATPPPSCSRCIDSGELYARVEREKPQLRPVPQPEGGARAPARARRAGRLADGAGRSDAQARCERSARARRCARGSPPRASSRAEAPLDSPAYDDAVVAAVKAFQEQPRARARRGGRTRHARRAERAGRRAHRADPRQPRARSLAARTTSRRRSWS